MSRLIQIRVKVKMDPATSNIILHLMLYNVLGRFDP